MSFFSMVHLRINLLSKGLLCQLANQMTQRHWFQARTLLIPAENNGETQTINDVILKFSKLVKKQVAYEPEKNEREHLLQILPKKQSELPSRRMLDSYDSAIVPLASDIYLRERYRTYHNTVRVGRLLEDLDVFAVWLCYKHVKNPKQRPEDPSPYSIVTALVDQINFGKDLKPDFDIRLRGHVTWVGTSSLEASLEVDQQLESGEWHTVTNGTFVLVARDPLNKGSAIINPLIIETEKEKECYLRGEENKKRRLLMERESLIKLPPSEDERQLIHKVFLKTIDPAAVSFKSRLLPPNTVWMENAKLKNMFICHPQNRNMYNKIFGGFLMRVACELAWANAYVFSKCMPRMLHIDDILFRKPVEVGSLLYLASQVAYVYGNRMVVRVSAEVVNAESGKHDLTNNFYFILEVDREVPKVMPKSYEEAMIFLDGRRHLAEPEGTAEITSKL
ncbi:acyl-coenzyme A thioesterase 9, mitochondrial-like isoform X2 [Artemia franciscana]|uniref:acyl-coenzyme A thioesterase 9, mitochondrial-like isoform X2 n=1 Tax=Artemia franciscana TaxID=6661 RepID=UPI0032DAF945